MHKGNLQLKFMVNSSKFILSNNIFKLQMATNLAPAAVTLSNQVMSLSKKAPAGIRKKVADLSITDDGLGYNTWSLTGADASKFEIIGHALYLKAGVNLINEKKETYNVTVSAQDKTISGAAPVQANYSLSFDSAANEAPSSIALKNTISTFKENTSTATRRKVADIVITDDGLGTNTLSISGADADKFEIEGRTLYLKAGTSLDYETKSSYKITVQAQDTTLAGFTPVSADYTLNISDVNEGPTSLSLINARESIAENSSKATRIKVADINITDDALGSNTLSLAGADAAKFEIMGRALYLKAGTTLDYETKSSYTITVQAQDKTIKGSSPVSTSYTLNVSDLNEGPTSLRLNNALESITENSSTTAPIKVADISILDDALGSNTMTLSGNDANLFEITGNTLYLKAGTNLDYETKSRLQVSVQAQDTTLSGSAPIKANYILSISDVNEAPTSLTLKNTLTSLTDTTTTTTKRKVADIVLKDDGIGNNTLTLSGTDAANFEISGSTLYLRSGLNPNEANKSSYNVTIQAQDTGVAGSSAVQADYVLNIGDMNKAPTALALNDALTTLAQNASTRARIKVANIAITDDGLGTNTLSLTGTDADKFEIIGQALYLKAGTNINDKTKATYQVNVQVQDASLGAAATPIIQSYTLGLPNATANTTTNTTEKSNQAPTVVGTVEAQVTEQNASFEELNLGSYFADSDTGDTRQYSVSSTTPLPAGMTLNARTGVLSGTPTSTGSFPLAIKMTDSGGLSATQTFELTVNEPGRNDNAPVFTGIPTARQQVSVGAPTSLHNFTLNDPDSKSAALTLTLTTTNGTLSGLVDTDPTANGIQLQGTASQIQAALAQARFTATAAGDASINTSVSDGIHSNTATYALNAVAGKSLSINMSTDTYAQKTNGTAVDASYTNDGITRATAWALNGVADSKLGIITIRDGNTQLGTATANATTGVWSYSPSTITLRGAGVANGVYQQIALASELADISNTDGLMTNNFGPTRPITLDMTRPAYKATISGEQWFIWAATGSGYRITKSWNSDNWYSVASDNLTVANPEQATAWVHHTEMADSGTAVSGLTLEAANTFSEGEHRITVSQGTLTQGTYAEQSITLKRDSSAPTVRTQISTAQSDENTVVSTNGTLTDSTPLLKGTADALALVRVFDNNTFIGEATADQRGQWELQLNTTSLSSRTHTLRAKSIDSAGNESPMGDGFTLTIDGNNAIGLTSNQQQSHGYIKGDVVQIVLRLDDALTFPDLLTSRPTITLQIGDHRRIATMIGSKPNELRHEIAFEYTIQSDDIDTDGITVVPNSLALNGSRALIAVTNTNANLKIEGDWVTNFLDASVDGTQTAVYGPSSSPTPTTSGITIPQNHDNAYINGMLGKAKWNWSTGDKVLTYYLGKGYNSSYHADAVDWSEAAHTALTQIFQSVTDATGVQFREVFNAAQANLVEWQLPDSVLDGAAMHGVVQDGTKQSTGYFSASRNLNAGVAGLRTAANYGLGASGNDVMTHEIGHALGLTHPFDTAQSDAFPGVIRTATSGTKGDNDLNSNAYSTESYSPYLFIDKLGLAVYAVNQTSPAAFDIAALQELYGKNMSTRTGDNTYDMTDVLLTTIWDAGGNDTLSASASTKSAIIDLRAATLQNENGGGGFISAIKESNETVYVSGVRKNYDVTLNPITIANGVVIENAMGSRYNDQILTNSSDNTLTGNGGNDTFYWMAGQTGTDTVTDFAVTFSGATSTGDKLNLSSLIQSLAGSTNSSSIAIANYVDLTRDSTNNANAVINVHNADHSIEQRIVLTNAWDTIGSHTLQNLQSTGVIII